MPLILDIAPSTAIVYMMDAHGYVLGVRSAENLSVGTHDFIIYGRPLDPLYLNEEPLLSSENSDTYPQVARPLRIVTRTGFHFGVPIRFLGPGTGGMSGM